LLDFLQKGYINIDRNREVRADRYEAGPPPFFGRRDRRLSLPVVMAMIPNSKAGKRLHNRVFDESTLRICM